MRIFITALSLLLVFSTLASQARELTDKEKRYATLAQSYLQHIQSKRVGKTKEQKSAAANKSINTLLSYFYACNAVYAQINAGNSVIPSSDETRHNGLLMAEHMSSAFVAVQTFATGIKAKELAGEPVTKAVNDAKESMSDQKESKNRLRVCQQFLNDAVLKVEANAQQQVKEW